MTYVARLRAAHQYPARHRTTTQPTNPREPLMSNAHFRSDDPTEFQPQPTLPAAVPATQPVTQTWWPPVPVTGTNAPAHAVPPPGRPLREEWLCYVLLLTLGLVGAHHHYLLNRGRALALLLLTLSLVGLPVSLLWVLVEVFLVPSMVAETNRRWHRWGTGR